ETCQRKSLTESTKKKAAFQPATHLLRQQTFRAEIPATKTASTAFQLQRFQNHDTRHKPDPKHQ
ncbi:hypothetical protein ACOCGK_003618, partial [Vibrio cholerae]